MESNSEEPNSLILWRDFILHKKEVARQHGNECVIRHWDGVLDQYLKITGLETYISPFSGREV